MTVTPRSDVPGAFTVKNGRHVYNVLLTIPDYGCDCADFLWRDRKCKHIVAAEAVFNSST